MLETILPFVLIGFLAQLVDGALGMAYGVTSNSVLLSLGISPAASSASVHAAEVITTGISGLSHHWLGNIDKDLMKRLVIPGVLGGVVGAYLLTSFPREVIKPFLAVYRLIMGLLILRRAFMPRVAPSGEPNPALLGLVGGFFDAVGAGGWGSPEARNRRRIAPHGARYHSDNDRPCDPGGDLPIPRVLLAMTDDLAFVLRLEDVGRELGLSVVALSSPDELGEDDEFDVQPIPLTEPLAGQDAALVRRLAELQPVLILIDLNHPRLPWERWIQTLKTSAATQRFPIIAFGPPVDGEAFARARRAGADQAISRGKIHGDLAKILLQSARQVDETALEMSCGRPLSDSALEGLALLNSGRYFEAHESMERAWMDEAGVEGFLYRALLQVAVTYLHIERGNYRGAAKMLLRIHNWLDPLPANCRGIAVDALKRNVQALRRSLDDLGPEGMSSLDRTLLAPIPVESSDHGDPGS